MRGALVIAQVALACVLVFGSALLLRSSGMLAQRDHGFDPGHALTFGLTFPDRIYDPDATVRFYAEAGRRLREIPGVQFAGLGTSLPWTGYDENTLIEVPGYVPRAAEIVQARYQAATPGFIEALGMHLVRGRTFLEGDRSNAPKVILINEALARRYFSDRDPIGHVADIWGASREVVGVVADVRDWPADGAAVPAFWFPLEQVSFARVTGSVRAAGDRGGLLPAIRAALASIDPELPLSDVRYLSAIADTALAERRFTLWTTETFSFLAMGLAALGIYALLAYSVKQRQREIGVRLALGATRGQILGSILWGGLVLASLGTVAGLVMAPLAGRTIEAALFGVQATDLVALLVAPAIVLAVAAIASLGPALFAMRTEPMSALRDQ
jgi:predicted permease